MSMPNIRLFLTIILVLVSCSAALAQPSGGVPKAPTVILITIDGFPALALDDPHLPMPVLHELIAGGAVAASMMPSNPTITWPNHTSLVTGVDAKKHHVVTNGHIVFYADGSAPVSDSLADQTTMVHSRTLYEAAADKGLTTAQIHWVAIRNAKGITWEFSEQATQNDLIARELIARGDITADQVQHFYDSNPAWRDQIRTAATVHMIEKYAPNLIMLHLAQTDAIQHEYGPSTSAAYEAFASVDECLRRIIDATKRKGIYASTTFIITSDHGFANSHHSIQPNVVLAQMGLVRREGGTVLADAWVKSTGGSALVYVQEPTRRPMLVPLIQARFAKISGIAQVLTNSEARSLGIPAEIDTDQAPQLYLVAAPDYSFGEDSSGELVRDHAQTGEHGFINTMNEMQTVFVAYGVAIRPGIHIPSISNLRVAPTIAQILGVSFPEAALPPLNEILKPEFALHK
jgi:predicted AlkP superfamily pyrophosphatase or phosphodiesterase